MQNTRKRTAQVSLEYITTYAWAAVIMIIIIATLFALGVFDMSNYAPPAAEVVGFNTFVITSFIVHADGEMNLALSNTLEDRVTITGMQVNGVALTSPSPAFPFNMSAAGNVTFAGTTAQTDSMGRPYELKLSILFDVDRGTTGHIDSGFLRSTYQP